MTNDDSSSSSKPLKESSSTLYSEMRKRQVPASREVRIYGILLANEGHVEDHTPIAYCGFMIDGIEQRECSNRIWHIPDEKVISTGVVDDFKCDGEDVQFFQVARDTFPVEEQYLTLSLGMLLDQALQARRLELTPSEGVFAARVGEPLAASTGSAPGFVIPMKRVQTSSSIGGRLGLDTGGPYQTTWVDTREAGGTKKDPMTDDAKLYYW